MASPIPNIQWYVLLLLCLSTTVNGQEVTPTWTFELPQETTLLRIDKQPQLLELFGLIISDLAESSIIQRKLALPLYRIVHLDT